MSMYQRLNTPNSPLLPLSPMPMASPSMFLSPYTTSIRSRRSFTPSHLNVLPPPSVSPIQATKLSAKNKVRNPLAPITPDKRLESGSPSSIKSKSMKKVRSEARLSRKFGTHMMVPLTPIRRALFADASPTKVEIETPKAMDATISHLVIPNWRAHLTPQPLGTSAMSQGSPVYMQHQDHAVTPNLLEETFTVMSILKEINMEKYSALFVREEIDLFVFLLLTRNDMIELGIEKADRIILMKAIRCYTEFFGKPNDKMYY